MMKKTLLRMNTNIICVTGFFLFFFNASAVSADSAPPLFDLPSQLTVDYLAINMPDNTPKMGLVGLHYDVNLLPVSNFYTGIGGYSAVQGKEGGFFALGIDNVYRLKLTDTWFASAGLFVGGGGARSALVGGGLMVLPYVGLAYQIDHKIIAVNYSYVKFPSGQISGSQVMASLTVPLEFSYFHTQEQYSLFDAAALDLPINKMADWSSWSFGPLAQVYKPRRGNVNLSGLPQQGRIGLVGFEAAHPVMNNLFVDARLLAAGKGNANGYMDALFGLLYRIPLSDSLYWDNDAMIGAGGGGQVDTGNGMLVAVDTGLGWSITPNFSLKGSVGYLDAIDGKFRAATLTVGANYSVDFLSARSSTSTLFSKQFTIKNWQVTESNALFIKPQRSHDSGNINFIETTVNQFILPDYFVRYRAGFAYQGTYTGGMALGMLGAGYQTQPLFNLADLRAQLSLSVGAIGGGGIAAQGGAVTEPEADLNYQFNESVGLTAGVGRVISFSGNLNSTVVNAGLTFSFGKGQSV